jgi:hypothetical protein
MNDGDRFARPSDAKVAITVSVLESLRSLFLGRAGTTRPDHCTTLVRRSLSRLTRRLKNIRLGPGNKPTTQT